MFTNTSFTNTSVSANDRAPCCLWATFSELSAAQLVLVRGCVECSDSEFTRKMYPLMPIFDPKKAPYGKNFHLLLMRCTEVIDPLFIKQDS